MAERQDFFANQVLDDKDDLLKELDDLVDEGLEEELDAIPDVKNDAIKQQERSVAAAAVSSRQTE